MTAPVLELKSVTAGYGDNPIVRDFSARRDRLELEDGGRHADCISAAAISGVMPR